MSKKGMKYDYKEAYNKNLKPSAELHYLENARHDEDSGSPNHFTGLYSKLMEARMKAIQANQAATAAPVAPIAPVAPTAGVSAGAAISGGAMDPTNPFAGKTFKIEPASPMGMVDPSLASVGIDASQTFQPPMASNEIGGAKDLFGDKTRGMAQTIYGTPEQRQISVNSPYTMKSIPEGDKGAGLRALPDNVVENMGYDAATKMVSPLNDNHPGDKKMLRRAASVLTGGISEVAAGVAQRVKNYNNTPKQNFAFEKAKHNMPKKRANGGHPGYVVDLKGNRIPTETIKQETFTQAQNILKKNK